MRASGPSTGARSGPSAGPRRCASLYGGSQRTKSHNSPWRAAPRRKDSASARNTLAASVPTRREVLPHGPRRGDRSRRRSRSPHRARAPRSRAPRSPRTGRARAGSSTGPSMLNSASRTRSGVGRVLHPGAPSGAGRYMRPPRRASMPDQAAIGSTSSAPNRRSITGAAARARGRRARGPKRAARWPRRGPAPAARRPRAAGRRGTRATRAGGCRARRPRPAA